MTAALAPHRLLLLTGKVAALLSLLAGPVLLAGAETLATFECKERLGIDWDPLLLTYPVTFPRGTARLDQLRLVDNADEEQPVQLSRTTPHDDGSIATARVSFLAGLKKGGSFRYRLLNEPPTVPASPCSAETAASYLVLSNGVVAIRLPAAGDYKHSPAERFAASDQETRTSNPGVIPGPFQGMRLADGRWVGNSFVRVKDPALAPRVTGYSSRVIEQGPLFVEARVHYDFENGGFYEWTARLLANDPAMQIDEQFDFKVLGSSDAMQLVVLLENMGADAWKPDSVLWYSDRGNLPGRDNSLEARFAELGFATNAYSESRFGSGKLSFDQPEKKVFHLSAWVPWEPNAHYFALLNSSRLAASTPADLQQTPFLGVVPMHVGNWRNAQSQHSATTLVTQPDGHVALHRPLTAARHPFTYIQSGEYDRELPFSYTRRQWALVGGPLSYHDKLYHLRRYAGFVNLDDYKDWVLEWKADPAVTYPRLLSSRDEAIRVSSNAHPAPGADSNTPPLYVKDDEQRRATLWSSATNPEGDGSPLGQTRHGLLVGNASPWFTYYRQAQSAGHAFRVEELLASDKLTSDQRDTLRAHVAGLYHLLTEPDFNPRGSMVHLGNPNMPINRFFALPIMAALIPDHPEAKKWLKLAHDYLGYKLATMVAPGNAWGELLTYYGASAPHLLQSALVLDRAGYLTEAMAAQVAGIARFPIAMLTPKDPRYGGRFLPNWGHEGSDLTTHWLPAAQLIQKRDPQLAKDFLWAWDQLGRPVQHQHDAGFSSRLSGTSELASRIPATHLPKDLESQWLPGFGATMRAHAGSPDETYLALRQGYFTSHSDPNQGDFVLFSKGVPFSTLNPFAYRVLDESPFRNLLKTVGWHNTLHFGAAGETGSTGGPYEGVQAFSRGASVDYLRSSGDYGPQRWIRQVLFLKGKSASGPNYFVFRDSSDSLAGNADDLQPKWWSLRTLGSKSQVVTTKNEINYTSAFGPRLNTHFLQPAAVEMQTADASVTGSLANQAAINWKKAGSPVDEKGAITETMTVTSAGPIPAAQDVLVALYPQTKSEAPPKYELLADGVARITTTEGADYIFAGREPLRFEQGDVSFRGVAGAVRIYPSEVHLIVAEGPAAVTYAGTTLHSTRPVQKVIRLSDLKNGRNLEQPAVTSTIAFAIDAAAGAVEDLAPGVKRQVVKGRTLYGFDSATAMTWKKGGVVFSGKRGGIIVDEVTHTIRLVLIEGTKIVYRDMEVGNDMAPSGAGPYDVTFHPDRVVGHSEGEPTFLYVRAPSILQKLPMLVLDGNAFAPGTNGEVVIVPIMAGEHRWELRALPQPPVFRNWQAW